jgi:Family of unknown function (DUF6204)
MTNEPNRVFRVTVRGRFADLTDQARQYLTRSQPDHDIFKSAYTPEGTFTYDDRIAFFNLRYELRGSGADAVEVAELEGLDEAERFLGTMGFGYTALKATVTDMSAMVGDRSKRDGQSSQRSGARPSGT